MAHPMAWLCALTWACLIAQAAAATGLHCALEAINVHAARHARDGAVELRVDNTLLQASGALVTVTWQGVINPTFDDWIALYVPANADVTQTAPSKFKYACDSSTHLTTGAGSLTFKLINYRQDMVFGFMRGGLSQAACVAVSPVLRFKNPNEPLQGHVALTHNPRSMSLQWASWNASSPTVQWGFSPDDLDHTQPASSRAYTRDDMCGGVAATVGWTELGLLHEVIINDLPPAQRIYWKFGDPEWGWSNVRSFLTPPLPGSGFAHPDPMRPAPRSSVTPNNWVDHMTAHKEWVRRAGRPVTPPLSSPAGPRGSTLGRRKARSEESVRVLLVGDMGQAEEDGANSLQEAMYPSLNTTQLLTTEGDSFSLLLHVGDLSYSRGYHTQWDNFMVQIESIASSMPYMVLPGNHERDWPGTGDRFDECLDSAGECGVPFFYRFIMPTTSNDDMWFSFKHGPIHFITYSTEHPTHPGSPQFEFLAADLAAIDRSITPWVVLAGHRPMYVSSTNNYPVEGDQLVASQLRADLEQLLVRHKVDLTLHGHHHSYQRTCPVINGTCQGWEAEGVAAAPIHLVIGHAGAGLSLNFQQPTPAYIDQAIAWWGYARAEATLSQLVIEVISDLDGGIMDRLVLKKPESKRLVHPVPTLTSVV